MGGICELSARTNIRWEFLMGSVNDLFWLAGGRPSSISSLPTVIPPSQLKPKQLMLGYFLILKSRKRLRNKLIKKGNYSQP
jgi:hypothetical protein